MPKKDWVRAHWILFWVMFHDQTRLSAFREMISKCGLTKREAAEMLQSLNREPV